MEGAVSAELCAEHLRGAGHGGPAVAGVPLLSLRKMYVFERKVHEKRNVLFFDLLFDLLFDIFFDFFFGLFSIFKSHASECILRGFSGTVRF